MRLGLSTSWNAFRHTDGRRLIFEIQGAGFTAVELGFNLTAAMCADIERLARKKAITALSCHNFCPIPPSLPRRIALPDYYALSSSDEAERAKSIRFTKGTIDTVYRLGAKVAVLHAGRVEIPQRTRKLIALWQTGKKNSAEFRTLRRSMIEERNCRARQFFDNTLRSLDALNAYACKKQVLLGIENRFYFREIPGIDEIGIILKSFKGGALRYWHDTGHAQIMEELGFAAHADFLKRYGKYLAGVHLHDVANCRDHMSPGMGKLNFKEILNYVPKQAIVIIEAHHPATVKELQKSRALIESLLNEPASD